MSTHGGGGKERYRSPEALERNRVRMRERYQERMATPGERELRNAAIKARGGHERNVERRKAATAARNAILSVVLSEAERAGLVTEVNAAIDQVGGYTKLTPALLDEMLRSIQSQARASADFNERVRAAREAQDARRAAELAARAEAARREAENVRRANAHYASILTEMLPSLRTQMNQPGTTPAERDRLRHHMAELQVLINALAPERAG